MIIVFTFNKQNLLSKLISKFTKSQWSHCFLLTNISIGNDKLIIESSFHGGVKFNLLSLYLNKNKFILEAYKTVGNYNNVESLIPFIGKNYGVLQILGFIIAKLLKLKNNPITKNIVCSELVLIWLLYNDHRDNFSQLLLNNAVPEDLYKIIKNDKDFILTSV